MSATAAVKEFMENLKLDPSEDRESLARQLYYWQMEIYSSHAGRDLCTSGDYEFLPANIQQMWLKSADRRLEKAKEKADE